LDSALVRNGATAAKARNKKPRGEQLLDRIDKNPNDREAWNELARESPTKGGKKEKDQPASTEVA
jgi:hypothetical protein